MSIINVDTKTKSYPIYIEKDFSNIEKAFLDAGLRTKKVLIITDTNVSKLYLEEVKNELKDIADEIYTHIFPYGEASKNIDTIKDIYKTLMDNKFDRKSIIVALGGGVCGDMAGFAAATYMRGIKFIQIPTSLLAQVDSSVGGKTGIDFLGGKNLIGAFYQPELVYINVSSLKTLPHEEFISGMGEVIKHGLIRDKGYFNYIVENKEEIKNMDESTLIKLIEGSCKIKAEVVSLDEKEQGIREVLNFGHTFGHSIESLYNFKLSHGKCVVLGFLPALYLSEVYGGLDKKWIPIVKEILNYFDFNLNIDMFTKEEIYEQMFYDKKVKEGKLTFVILKEMGNAISIDNVEKKDLFDSLDLIKSQRYT